MAGITLANHGDAGLIEGKAVYLQAGEGYAGTERGRDVPGRQR